MTKYWYKNAIIYSLDVKSFIDSNGDGIGDLAGLAGGLDYLACLGINCIWMLPFYPVNHTSNQHPWFKAARSDKNSPYVTGPTMKPPKPGTTIRSTRISRI